MRLLISHPALAPTPQRGNKDAQALPSKDISFSPLGLAVKNGPAAAYLPLLGVA